MDTAAEVKIREARESDVEAVCDLFRAAYGADYAFPQYFDSSHLKRLVFNDRYAVRVMPEPEDRRAGADQAEKHHRGPGSAH